MVVATHRSPPTILHIRPDGNEGARGGNVVSSIAAALAASPLTVERLGDVYRGLARLCARRTNLGTEGTDSEERSGSRDWRHHDWAVVVCVDDLGHAEFEFFSLAAQMRSDCPVYVYSDGRSDFGLNRAMAAGATGIATEAIVRSLQEKSQSPNAQTPKQPSIGPSKQEGAEGDSGTEHPGPEGTARVPWLHYTDNPRRQAPPRRTGETSKHQNVKTSKHPPTEQPRNPTGKSVQDEAGVAGPTGNCGAVTRGEGNWTGIHTPLLTPEELRALLSDDIATLAPHESEGPSSAPSSPTRGPSGNAPPKEGEMAEFSGSDGDTAEENDERADQ